MATEVQTAPQPTQPTTETHDYTKKQGLEVAEQKQQTHKIRITLTSRNVKSLEKGVKNFV